MQDSTSKKFRVGEWSVDAHTGEMTRRGETVRLEIRALRLLLCLVERAGEVVSLDQLVSEVWQGVAVSSDSVYQAVASLRRQLGDDPKQPIYIATVPRIGYRLVAKVAQEQEAGVPPPAPDAAILSHRPRRTGITPMQGYAIAVVTALCAMLVLAPVIRRFLPRSNSPVQITIAAAPEKSVAVLPFLDLTEGMKEEEFADGMTEELIDRLSRIPELRVSGATSSFYFKGKQVPPGEIAKSLGVSYLVDGSVRKSGDHLRVAARLVRATNGYVVWSDSYDRPLHDILTVQDDIAGAVTKALSAQL